MIKKTHSRTRRISRKSGVEERLISPQEDPDPDLHHLVELE